MSEIMVSLAHQIQTQVFIKFKIHIQNSLMILPKRISGQVSKDGPGSMPSK